MVNNKLLCTFSSTDSLEALLTDIQYNYTLLYNRIFVLETDGEEYICTYRIDFGNISNIPDNTIMVHRKKETNTLYTINAINEIIKTLNNGILNKSLQINWNNYKNCVLLTQNNEFKKINTKIFKIIYT